MIEGWVLWLLLVGIAVATGVMLVLMVRLPREEDDVGLAERPAEAAWIAGTIERHGGVAPATFVHEVLDLHQAYLQAPRAGAPDRYGPPPVAPPPMAHPPPGAPPRGGPPSPGQPPSQGQPPA